MSYEQHFMEFIQHTHLADRDKMLDTLIQAYIDKEGLWNLVIGLDLEQVQSENFGCTVQQVAYDVVHFDLEQAWLREQEYWYAVLGEEGYELLDAGELLDNEQRQNEGVVFGPFSSQEDADTWIEENDVWWIFRDGERLWVGHDAERLGVKLWQLTAHITRRTTLWKQWGRSSTNDHSHGLPGLDGCS